MGICAFGGRTANHPHLFRTHTNTRTHTHTHTHTQEYPVSLVLVVVVVVVVRCGRACLCGKVWMVCCAVFKRTNVQREGSNPCL